MNQQQVLRIKLVTQNSEIQKSWMDRFEQFAKTLDRDELDWHLEVEIVDPTQWGSDPGRNDTLWFVDEQSLSVMSEDEPLSNAWKVLVLSEEQCPISSLMLHWSGIAQDVVVHPFRLPEVLSKLRFFEESKGWEEVKMLNHSFTETASKLREDVDAAHALAARLAPKRKEELKQFSLSSLYLAGLRPGGDYFEAFEIPGTNKTVLWLSDCSSYGVTATILSLLSKLFIRLAKSPQDAQAGFDLRLAAFLKELTDLLKPNDTFSFFMGFTDSDQQSLEYLRVGAVRAFVNHQELEGRDASLTAGAGEVTGLREYWKTAALRPGDRFLLLSDGFQKALRNPLQESLSHLFGGPAEMALSELALRVRIPLSGDQDELPFPEQDCTAVVLETKEPKLRSLKDFRKKEA